MAYDKMLNQGINKDALDLMIEGVKERNSSTFFDVVQSEIHLAVKKMNSIFNDVEINGKELAK